MPERKGEPEFFEGYTTVLHVVRELLSDNELAKKTLFGNYVSPLTASWDQLRRSYEKDRVYAAEVASQMLHLVNFDIPHLRRTIAKREQQIAEVEKGIVDCVRKENDARNEYARACRLLGITGTDPKREIRQSADELPLLVDRFLASCRQPATTDALNYYEIFSGHFHPNTLKDGVVLLADLKRLLTDAQTSGNSSPLPLQTHESQNVAPFADIAQPEDDVDWTKFMVVEGGSAVESSVSSSLSATLVASPEDRARVVTDLMELHAFLSARVDVFDEGQHNVHTANAMFDALKKAPTVIQKTDIDQLRIWRDHVNEAIQLLESERAQQLFSIRQSDAYVTNLASKVTDKLRTAEKYVTRQQDFRNRQEEYRSEIVQCKEQMQVCIGRVRELQALLQKELSAQFDGRVIRLVGDITSL
jgi:hypothetical protein